MARTIKLNLGYETVVSSKDYGKVLRAGPWHVKFGKHKGGSMLHPYAVHSVFLGNHKWRTVRLHRFLLGVTSPKVKVDHKNGNGLDNQRRNLRKATNGQNKSNSKKALNTSSQFKGVRKVRNRWSAQITFNKHHTWLGSFAKEQDAADAYDKAAIKVHGEFALTNAMLRGKA
jgi:hypothetical protein